MTSSTSSKLKPFVLFAIFTVTDTWHGYLRAWLIPSCVAGIYQSIRKFTEHLGMASYDPMVGTRTVVGQNWFTRMCTYLNFDIFVHGPHHRHPLVPHRTNRFPSVEHSHAHAVVGAARTGEVLHCTL